MIGRRGAAAALVVAAAAPAWALVAGAGDAAGTAGVRAPAAPVVAPTAVLAKGSAPTPASAPVRAPVTARPASPRPGATTARPPSVSTATHLDAENAPLVPAAPDVFDAHAFERGRARLVGAPNPMPGARAIVIPHHWPAGALIAAGLRDLAATRRVGRVVLVGPDHAHAGVAPATTAAGGWRTPFGTLAGDAAAVDRLVATGLARRDARLIGQEHAIAGLAPAVRFYFPEAVLVPLAVRNDPPPRELAALGAALAGIAGGPAAGGDTVLVLSADFAHVASSAVARANDRVTLDALRALDLGRIRAFDAAHLDGRGALAVVLGALDRLDAARFTLRARSDASELPDVAGGPVTSYVVGYWR